MSEEKCVRCGGTGIGMATGGYRVVTNESKGVRIMIHEYCLVSFLLELAGGPKVLIDRYLPTPTDPTP